MTTTILPFVTISCDTSECGKSVTFPQTAEGEAEARKGSPWLDAMRFVQTIDGRKLGYCSDECEAKAIATGAHNKLEPKRIIAGANQQQVDLAAQAAAAAAKAQAALKAGEPVTVHPAS